MIDLTESFQKLRERLAAEQAKVDTLLKECGRDKVQPPKDYWHDLYHLKNKVATFQKVMEGINK